MSEHDPSRLGAYSLGALEPDEVREIDEHLAGCAECRQELAELDEMKEFLAEVPPEAFLDGPPADGDLLLQRTLREVRSNAAAETAAAEAAAAAAAAPPVTVAPRKKRSPWYLVAAAVVVIAGALGSGVLIGRQTAPDPTAPVAGSKLVTATDSVTQATMATTVEPRAGWSWIMVNISGLKQGAECEMVVTDKAGKTFVAGSWVVSPKAAREGSRFGGGVLVPIDQVRSVEIRTLQGEHVVTTPV
ncbi:putative zinc finger protein [Kribbella orskensis]|uniref:Zinc finger protein n=1 Tax=Kribbella orskensis TaxID=2512216 RepID=A0ABY2BIC3_9ACTN|nr:MULTISPECIES: zf-HC2 domain-containing protein [Kribbella]TCN37561.1 putative zinc finger protein [Kribbella sp. VKM Ac-2500]TCO18937.1 putative zinc finger protein [Kribbella orskensis]